MRQQSANHTASQRRLARLMAFSFVLTTVVPAQAALNIPDTPLQTSVSAEPNIMFILDDSGSMHWEITPDSYSYFVFPRPSNVYGSSNYDSYVSTTVDTSPYNAYTRSPQTNPSYYDPGTTYLPWSNADGTLWPNATPSAAYHNPAKTAVGTRNLTTDNTQTATWETCTSESTSSCSGTSTSRTFWPATYFWHNGGDKWNRSNYTKVEIRSTTANYSGHGRANRTDCTSGTCTYTQEIQNFANWYTYYRSRILTARAGIGRAFASQNDGLRVGFGTINKASTSVDNVSTQTIVSGVRVFKDSDRTNFFNTLYTRDIPTSSTPLRRALRDAGEYFSRNDDRGPWSTTPGQSGGSDLACRLSYTILMTDGYWNDSYTNSSIANSDNTAGATITGPNGQSYTYQPVSPFRDSHSDTLADVAMHYWKRDLRTDMTNVVPSGPKNPAFWQHMVTFGVGLGVNGSIKPEDAYAAIGDPNKTITWPNPTSSNAAKLDDLLHAAINGRGEFFSAQNPTEFANAMTGMLKEIIERKSSSSSVSLTGTRLSTGSKVFSPSFNTSGWIGELAAYNLSSNGVSSTPVWKASEKIPEHASRKIFVTTSSGEKREFLWGNLSTTDRTTIGSEAILNFLRGDRSQETARGGTLRTRNSLLGDIVHSSPVYHQGTQTVYVGANDGMLHAFNSETGVERFAYIPSAVLGNLRQLSATSYQHKYFVDGELTIADKSDTGLSSTYLVGTMGAGAKGLFALDITAPASFAASNIAWEYVNSGDTELGYMMGKPIYARLNDGSRALIVGNGYNSSSGKAALYIINLQTGALIRKFVVDNVSDSGMATPGIVDTNGDGLVDLVYAGDLKGNVWKFDLNSKIPSAWSQSKFFTAIGPDNNVQPITAQITSAVNYLNDDPNSGKRYIFFGTGSYFQAGDINDKSVQSWYGLIDTGSTISGRNNLTKRSISSTLTTADGKPARTFSKAATDATTGKVTDMTNKQGWYLDWVNPVNIKLGERVISPSVMYRLTEPTLLGSSITPEANDPCQPGGTGYVNAINAFTGGSLTKAFFTSEVSGDAVVGSLDLGIGMPSQPALVISDDGAGQLIVGGSGDTGASGTGGSNVGSTGFNPGNYGGRIYWREIIRGN